MLKRMSFCLLIVLLVALPVSAAAPADRSNREDRASVTLLGAVTDWLRLIGIDLEDEGQEVELPRSFSAPEEGGPHTDPSG